MSRRQKNRGDSNVLVLQMGGGCTANDGVCEDMKCNVIEELKPLIKPLNSVKLDPFNARKNHDIDGLALALDSLGQHRVVVANKSNGIITLGNGTYKAMQKLGWTHGAIVSVDDDKIDEVKRALADNKLGEGDDRWDNEILVQLLKTFEDPADVPGFSQTELDKLIEEVDGALDDLLGDEGEIVEDEPPIDKAEELQQVWQVQEGDLWALGRHRLICGDCTDKAVVDRLMDGERAEIAFTSPPYLNMRAYSGNDLSLDVLLEFIPVMSNACNFSVINLGLKFTGGEVVQYWGEYIEKFKACGDKLLAWNVWDKTEGGSIASATNMFLLTHEWLFVFGKQRKRLNRTIPNQLDKYEQRHGKDFLQGHKKTKRAKDGTMELTTTKTHTHHQLHSVVQQIQEKGTVRTKHPAVMPVGLPTTYIEAMTDENQLVYDPFLGSGTTLIASHQLNRICYGSEISPKYCAVILQRYADLTGETPIKL